jgi:hypothetical protein
MVVDGAGVSGPLASGLARSAADLLALIEHGIGETTDEAKRARLQRFVMPRPPSVARRCAR